MLNVTKSNTPNELYKFDWKIKSHRIKGVIYTNNNVHIKSMKCRGDIIYVTKTEGGGIYE